MNRHLRFILLFTAVWAGLTTAVFQSAPFLEWLCRIHASLLAGILPLLGIACEADGIFVLFPGRERFIMIPECTAVFVSIVFVAGVLAYPAPWRSKRSGIVWGVSLIAGINIARLVVLGLLYVRAPRFFEFFHMYLWHVAFVAIVVLMLVGWTEAARGVRKSAHVPA